MNAIGLYRVGNWCYRKKIPIVPKLMWRLIFLIFNSSIPCTATIGAGTRFAYGAIGVVVHGKAAIGSNCTIGTNVTIGGKSKNSGVPTIGNNVYISTGAKVLGNVKIGDNSLIGANAVVVKDVPNNCIVAGIPAEVIRENINASEYI